MIFAIDDRHIKDLNYLGNQDAKELERYCDIAFEYIDKAADENICQTAAQATRLNVSESEFFNCLNLPDSHKEVLRAFYIAKKDKLANLMMKQILNSCEYQNLSWRIDFQLASRCMMKPTRPVFIFRLDTVDNKGHKSEYFQTDPLSLNQTKKTLKLVIRELSKMRFNSNFTSLVA